jgi:hypothetical protein
MKVLLAIVFCALLAESAAVAARQDAASSKVKRGYQTITGYIGDSKCGLEHPVSMADAKECTLKCVSGGGKFILADRENKIVYALHKLSSKRARKFAGQKVKVTGILSKKKYIDVATIEPAS